MSNTESRISNDAWLPASDHHCLPAGKAGMVVFLVGYSLTFWPLDLGVNQARRNHGTSSYEARVDPRLGRLRSRVH